MSRFYIPLVGLLWLVGCQRAPETAPPSMPMTSAPPVALSQPEPIPALPPQTEPDPSAQILAQATALKQAGNLVGARDLLQPLTETATPPPSVLGLLSEINSQILFTPAAAPEKIDYEIVPGDSLGRLAQKFNTTIAYLKRSNNLSRDMIRAGDRLRVYQGRFSVEVSKTANTLTLKDNGKFLKQYRVGTGQYSKTPVGTFQITTRIENPDWYRADGDVVRFGHPENILGTHWLGLNVTGYGIHGTWATNSIGTQSSAGCVRLLNNDVAELYILLPAGTSVTIHE